MTYADAEPPDLVAPTSPSAALTKDIEKDLLKDMVLALASLVTCWRSIFGDVFYVVRGEANKFLRWVIRGCACT